MLITSVIFYLIMDSLCYGNEISKNDVYMAEIQSCRGCILTKSPDLKSFIDEDIQQYSKVVFRQVPGADPQLVLFDSKHQELKRIHLANRSRKECNMLLHSLGFKTIKNDIEYTKEKEL